MSDISQWIVWLLGVTLIPSFCISAISLYPIRRFANRLGLLARPGGHSSHTKVTPLGGGIGIWLGIIVTFAIGSILAFWARDWPLLSERLPSATDAYLDGARSRIGQLWGLLIAGTCLVGLGLWDDRHGLWWPYRLGAQFVVGAFVVFGLGFGLTAFIQVAWLTKCLSVVWIVAVINAFNMLDNMDGLSGGVAAIIAASLVIVMLANPDPGTSLPQFLVAGLLLVVCGSLLGFLWHNRPPAKIFMGDGGSYLVGFLIAVAMLMATYASDSQRAPHAILAPLCAMAVPLYDMTTVIWIRIREGRSPFDGDQSHFSHRLVTLGLTREGAVLTIYLVTATCGLAAILLTQVSLVNASMVLGIVACMLLLVIILESTAWRKNKDG